jgi:hypothetical protein
MKTPASVLRFPAALAALMMMMVNVLPAADARNDRAPARPADLQVVIDVPPTWRPFLEDDIAEALFSRLHDIFKLRGYHGKVVQIERTDDRQPGVPTLELALTEWRVDRVGNAQCTMTARLSTPSGEKNLGLATGTAIFWPNGSHWGFNRRMDVADALDDAANSAAREVYDAVANSRLLPGITPRK